MVNRFFNIGGMWATFGFQEWSAGQFAHSPVEVRNSSDNGLGNLFWTNQESSLEQVWYEGGNDARNEIAALSRKFNIDIFAKVAYN